jgi:hypothetical protein
MISMFAFAFRPETAVGKAIRTASSAGSARAVLGAGAGYDHVDVDFDDSPVTAEAGKFYHCDLTGGSIVINAPALNTAVEGQRIGIKISVAAGPGNTVTFEPNGAETVNGAANFAFDTDEEAHEFEVGTDHAEWMIAT